MTVEDLVEQELKDLLKHGVMHERLIRTSLMKMATMDTDLDGVGDWIQTFSGRAFYPLAPNPKDIVIEDIGHALGSLCRFNGHCNDFYSVAQHSILVSRICEKQHGPKAGLRGLLHDASEAYLCDIPKPVKRSALFKPYLRYEARLQAMIYDVFGLEKEDPPYLKAADLTVLATEKRDLMAPMIGHHEWEKLPEPLSDKILPAHPSWAKLAFLLRFGFLMRRM